MGHRALGGIVAVSLLAAGAAGGARAGDGDGARPAAFEVRVYPVRALARGHALYKAERGPYPVSPDQVNDETHPLFGSEGDDPVADFGGVDDLVERLKAEVGANGDFDRPGSFVEPVGENFVALRGPESLHARVADWLGEAARRLLRTVFLDVAAFAGDPEAADRGGGVPGAVASGAWVPLGFVRMVLAPQGGSAARAGGVRAYLADWDVEVAEDSATGDPIVGVAHEGLAVDVASSPAPGDRMRVRLSGWWAAPATWGQRATKDGDRIEVPSVRGARLEADVVLGGGTWTVLPSTEGTVFAARLRVKDPEAPVEKPAGSGPASTRSAAGAGPLVLRSFDVRDLTLHVRNGRGIRVEPHPSNYTPPDPRAQGDPAPLVSDGALVDLLKRVAPESWEREGASIERAGGALVARADEGTLAGVAALLDGLRSRVLRTTTVRAAVVHLPLSSLPEWWTGLPDDLTKDEGAALESRPGARVVEAASLRLREGQRLASTGGDRRSYVADYDVEIAKNSAIGNPIVGSLFEGLSLDVEADRLSGTAAVRLGLRVDHGRVVEMRGVPTRHGEIECPAVALLRLRGEATVGVGKTRVLGAWGVAGEIRLLLVTVKD